MAYVGYQTPISQADYLTVGLVSAVLGFFLMAYFFMYSLPYRIVTRSHIRRPKGR